MLELVSRSGLLEKALERASAKVARCSTADVLLQGKRSDAGGEAEKAQLSSHLFLMVIRAYSEARLEVLMTVNQRSQACPFDCAPSSQEPCSACERLLNLLAEGHALIVTFPYD